MSDRALETSELAREQTKTAEPAYLTALQVADLLQVDEKTVLRWSLQDSSMPVLRRGRHARDATRGAGIRHRPIVRSTAPAHGVI